jgi:4-oxalocrotonate tautomerase
MPVLTLHTREGLTLEQKRGLARDITSAVVKHLKIPPEALLIEITEYNDVNVARGGKLHVDAPPPV